MCRAFLTSLLAVALAGCSVFGQGTPCSQADADSRVSAVWRPAGFGGTDAAKVRLCADSICEERTSDSADDPIASLLVRLPDEIGASTVPVRVVVTSAKSGGTVIKDSARARLTEQYPNGASCPPTRWTATFRAHLVEGPISPGA